MPTALVRCADTLPAAITETPRPDRESARRDRSSSRRGSPRCRSSRRAPRRARCPAQQQPGDESDDRLLELSLRIDRAARDSHDRIVALADELRAEMAAKSAALDARLQAQLDDTAALQQRFEEVQEAVAAALARAEETTEALHVETGSLAGQARRALRAAPRRRTGGAGCERAARRAARGDRRESGGRRRWCDRLAAEVAELTRRVEQLDAIGEASTRAIERAVLEGLADLGKQLTPRRRSTASRARAMQAFARLPRSGDRGGRCQARRARLGADRRERLNACGPPVAGRRSFDQRSCVT